MDLNSTGYVRLALTLLSSPFMVPMPSLWAKHYSRIVLNVQIMQIPYTGLLGGSTGPMLMMHPMFQLIGWLTHRVYATRAADQIRSRASICEGEIRIKLVRKGSSTIEKYWIGLFRRKEFEQDGCTIFQNTVPCSGRRMRRATRRSTSICLTMLSIDLKILI